MMENVAVLDTYYASLSRRFLALLLDALFLGVIMLIANHIVPFLGGIAAWFFYAPILESSELRATPGKHLAGIQVADLAGRRISLRAALIRNVLKFVSGALLLIGFIMALFSEKKQTLHDWLADTTVVYGRSARPVVDAWMASVKEVFNSDFSGGSTISRLERLQALRDRGALTEEEFQAEKNKILAGQS